MVDNSIIEGNTASNNGGAIYTTIVSPVTVDNSTIEGNTANNLGGGIHASTRSPVTVQSSALLQNIAGSSGGALYNDGNNLVLVTIADSCIVGNSRHAIRNDEAMTIIAQSNWWGTTDGPGASFGGSGDTFSRAVDASNFLTAPILGCPNLGAIAIEKSPDAQYWTYHAEHSGRL